MTEPVRLTCEDGIATILLNRPEVGNALDVSAANALRDAIEHAAADEAIRCVVMTGAGRMFCVGGDVAAMASAGEGGARADFLDQLVSAYHEAVVPLFEMNKPLVTLVNGPAAGAGFSLAMSGDVVIAARSASFFAAYGAVGLTVDGAMSWLLPRIVGMRQAQRLILLNEKISAEEAEQLGLLTRLVDDEALMGEGMNLARRLKSGSMASIGGARTLLRQSFETGVREQLEAERASMVSAAITPECAEGVAAFVEKRRANFENAE